MSIITTSGLTMQFGAQRALDSLNVDVQSGVTGLVGANGAGETTLMSLVLGLRAPTEGKASVLGFDPQTSGSELRAQIGYGPERNVVPEDMPASDFVKHMAEVRGMPRSEARGRASDALWLVGLGEERSRALGTMSTGQRQRVKLAQAIGSDPALLLLDEPTDDLDISLVVALVSRTVGDDESTEAALELGTALMANLGFTIVVPIVALVFAAAAFGDLKADSTLVYLWMRPMDRWPMVVGAWLASVTVSLPLTLVPLTVAAVIANVGAELVWATILACAVGNLAYSAVFMLLGLLLKNSVVWGIGYILIWEGFVAGVSSVGERLAIRGYTRSVMAEQAGVDLYLGNLSSTTAVVVLTFVVLVAFVLSSLRLRSMDVA